MKRSIYLIIILQLLVFFIPGLGFSQNKEDFVFGKIMDNIRRVQFEESMQFKSLDSSTHRYLSELQKKGSWSDIDYKTRVRTSWSPQKHLDRLLKMSLAYSSKQSSYYSDRKLYAGLVIALSYWYDVNPNCSNWWYNQIAVPKVLGLILINLRYGKLPVNKELEHKLIVRMKQGNPMGQTGANKLDVAIHFIYRSCLTADSATLKMAIEQAFYPISITTAEGIQPDLSYHQHGAQLQTGSYGVVLITGEIAVADYLIGTPYGISGDKLSLLRKFALESYGAIIRGQYLDFNNTGRGVSRTNNLYRKAFAETLRKLKTFDPLHYHEYDTAIARLSGASEASYGIKPRNTYYWRSDFAFHTRPAYNFSIRSVSTRTVRCETGNNENLKGYFMSDGITQIVTKGDEYYNIFPLWDWTRLPGATIPELNPLPVNLEYMSRGTSTFTGGVSDGTYGANVYVMNDYHTQAKKSWFFFDDEVVCLGAGITSSASATVNTTVNQTYFKPDAIGSVNHRVFRLDNNKSYDYNGNLDWVWNDNIGYVFPQQQHINIKTQHRIGNWGTINQSGNAPATAVPGDIFQLGFPHGSLPINEKYAYIVVPGKTADQMKTYSGEQNKLILVNSDSVQAVHHLKLNIWQVVFYKQNVEFESGGIKIWADRPCILMVRPADQSIYKVHVADPTYKSELINVYLKVPGKEIANHLIFKMPASSESGSAVELSTN